MTKKTLFMARSNPVEGKEEVFNEWYANTHLPEVLAIPGFLNAQRFYLNDMQVQDQPYEYLAIYEIATDNVQETLQALGSAGLSASDAIDTGAVQVSVFDAISDLVDANAS